MSSLNTRFQNAQMSSYIVKVSFDCVYEYMRDKFSKPFLVERIIDFGTKENYNVYTTDLRLHVGELIDKTLDVHVFIENIHHLEHLDHYDNSNIIVAPNICLDNWFQPED